MSPNVDSERIQYILAYCLAYKRYVFLTGILVQWLAEFVTCRLTSPVWNGTDWIAGPKIRIVGVSFAALEMDKVAHLQFYDS